MICLAENTEKYKTFSVPIEEEVTRISKNGKEITKTISYRLQFTDCASFMASSSSNLADNLAERIHEIDLNMGMMMKNVNHAESNTKIVIVVLNTQTLN